MLLPFEQLAGAYPHVTDMGWHRWDTLRWRPESEDHMLAVAANWAENFIIGLIRKGVDFVVVKEALKYRDVGMVRQLLAGARTEPSILKAASDMDNNVGVLPCANGVVDLTTGTMAPLTSSLLNTKNTGIDYVPGATHHDWDPALSAIADEDTRLWVPKCTGAAATGQPDRPDR